MQRVPHDEKGVWIQQFKHINNDPASSRYYLDLASYLLYTVNVSVNDETRALNIEHAVENPEEKLLVSFGQFVTPHRNLNVFKKFYFDYNFSLNRRGRFTSFPTEDNSATYAQIIKDGENFSTFCDRYGLQRPGQDFMVQYPQGMIRIYFGFNQIRNFRSDITPIRKYEGLVSEVLADVADDCFTWIEIKDGYLDLEGVDLTDINFNKSSALLLDYKIEIDLNVLESWLSDYFSFENYRDMLESLSTSGIDFSLMLYPPIASGMQLEDAPLILSPNGILKNRLVTEVTFLVSRSFVDNSQKIFEVIFTDTKTGEVIYRADSLENNEAFTLVGKNINIVPEYLALENNVFEDLSGINYPTDKFKVTYNIPNDLKKYLANHLDYTILVRITDLTSEREKINVS